jgi:hypothetical protein
LLLLFFVTLGFGRSGSFAESAERQIDDLNPLFAVDDAIAPYGVEIGKRLFRDGFLADFPADFNLSTRSREVTSISRYFVRSALLPRKMSRHEVCFWKKLDFNF